MQIWISCRYENALLLVTQAIDTMITGEGLNDKDLVISKLLRQDMQKYRSLFPHVSAAIQSKKYPCRIKCNYKGSMEYSTNYRR